MKLRVLLVRELKRQLKPKRTYNLTDRQIWYREVYLKSPMWANRRKLWWERHPNAGCIVCGRKRGRGVTMDLHHLTYARIGCELDTDLGPACRTPCHPKLHGRRR